MVPGAFRGAQGTWQLVIDPETNTRHTFWEIDMGLAKGIAVGLFALLLFTFGVVCLLWPEKIQRYYSRHYARYDLVNRKIANRLHLPDWWVKWMMRPNSIVELRVGGAIAISASTLLLLALIK